MDIKTDISYLTLSHAWGNIEMPVLIGENLRELTETGINEESLPATFREAFEITRKLGYEWIWINSFCIVQDSAEDWGNEAPRMASVYANAVLNIAAVGKDGHSGCFRRRNPLAVAACRVGHVSLSLDRSSLRPAMQELQLLNRAWFLQERVMAPRVLYVGESQLFWECVEGSAFEDEPVIRDHLFDHLPEHRQEKKHLEDDLQLTSWEHIEDNVETSRDAWQRLLQVYCNSALTFQKDRFVALSAIKDVFQESKRLTYHNGLWAEHLPLALLWFMQRPVEKASVSTVPSWSWASLSPQRHRCHVLRYEASPSPFLDPSTVAYLLGYSAQKGDVCAELKAADQTIVGAERITLKLRGRFRQVRHGIAKDSPNEHVLFAADANFSVDEPLGRYYPDSFEPESGNQHETGLWRYDGVKTSWGLVCFAIQDEFSSSSPHYYCLVLEPYGNAEGQYQRVGYFASEDSEKDEFGGNVTGVEENTILLF